MLPRSNAYDLVLLAFFASWTLFGNIILGPLASFGGVGIFTELAVPLMIAFLRPKMILIVVGYELLACSLVQAYQGQFFIIPFSLLAILMIAIPNILIIRFLRKRFHLSLAWSNLLSPVAGWPLILTFAVSCLLVFYFYVSSFLDVKSILANPHNYLGFTSSDLSFLERTQMPSQLGILAAIALVVVGFFYVFVLLYVPFKVLRTVERRMPEIKSLIN